MMTATTDRQVEVELTLKAAAGPIDARELQKLLWHRDQKLNSRLLERTPTENGEGVTQA